MLTHEFGHVLGHGHEVMPETLGVGERDLPFDDATDSLDEAPLSSLDTEADLILS